MNIKELFDKYYSRLAREGFFKSLFCGLIVGFAVDFVVAFLCWYFGASGVLWSVLALVVVTAATTPIFYFKKFKPSIKEIAKRLDSLGLEERMITMTEFQQDDSYIAQRQREDAKLTLHKVDTKKIRFVFSRAMLIVLAATFLFGGAMTTVSGLTEAGILKPGKDVIDNILPDDPTQYITITYTVSEGEGLIEGDDVQIIEVGEDCVEVIAVADDGFGFVEWSDGVKDPARTDLKMDEDMEISAIFAPIGDGGDEMPGDGDGQGDGGPGDGDKPGKSPKPTEEDGPPGKGANGSYEQNNMVQNGETYYRDILESGMYYEEAMKWLETAENVPEDLKEFIQTYFEILV